MSEGFRRFRDTIFRCPLPEPKFALTRAATFRGKFVYRRVGDRILSPEIRLSLNFNLPRREWEDVLIHEMIHYVIALQGVRETSHGPTFRRMMADINSRFGRNIAISHRAENPAAGGPSAPSSSPSPSMPKPWQPGDGTIPRRNYICVACLADGRLGLFRAAATRLFKVWDLMKGFPQVKQWRWIGSMEPAFARIPKSLNGALYILPDYKPWLPVLLTGTTLERSGREIRPVPEAAEDLPDWLSRNFPL